MTNFEAPYHINDATMKFSSAVFRQRQHQYLRLPGKYLKRRPTELVTRQMENLRMDELYEVTGDVLINLEEESGHITEKTLERFSKYREFVTYIYGKPVITAVICHKDPKNFPKEYFISETDILRPKYIHFSDEELLSKYENVINKIEQKVELSEMEALDLAFIPKYISKKHKRYIIKVLSREYKKAIIEDEELKRDVGLILETMVKHYIKDETEKKYLLGVLDVDKNHDDVKEIVYDVFGKELDEKEQQISERDKEIQSKNQEIQTRDQKINEYKNVLDKLNQIPDLNPDAREIIESLMK